MISPHKDRAYPASVEVSIPRRLKRRLRVIRPASDGTDLAAEIELPDEEIRAERPAFETIVAFRPPPRASAAQPTQTSWQK